MVTMIGNGVAIEDLGIMGAQRWKYSYPCKRSIADGITGDTHTIAVGEYRTGPTVSIRFDGASGDEEGLEDLASTLRKESCVGRNIYADVRYSYGGNVIELNDFGQNGLEDFRIFLQNSPTLKKYIPPEAMAKANEVITQ